MLNQDKSALPPSSCITIGDVMTYWDHTQAAAPFLFAPENNAVLTYGQLAIEARHLLAWFDEQGISKRGHVGLFMHNGRQTATVFFSHDGYWSGCCTNEFISPC